MCLRGEIIIIRVGFARAFLVPIFRFCGMVTLNR